MKRLTSLIISGVAASMLLIGCGGGGSASTDDTSSATVSGTLEASYLKGVKVCVKNSSNCAVSDANGVFTLSGVTLPAELELKVGNSVLADVNMSTDNYVITPAVLAENNTTVAAYIGAMLHGIGNCDDATGICDFSSVTSVDINTSSDLPVVLELKEILKNNASANINVIVNNNTIMLTEANATLYATMNPGMTGVSTYSFNGAASEGDYATFSYDSENGKITYTLSGNVFGNVSGSREIENVYGNVFFKDKDGDIYYFFSGSMGVAMIPEVNASDPTQVAYVVGLQQPQKEITQNDLNLIVNKTFNYIEFDDSDVYFSIIDINSSNTANLNGTWRDYVDGSTGTWEVNGTHLDVFDSNGNKIANVVIRAGSSRAGIVVDNVDGGFGVGVEAKPLSNDDLKGKFYYNDTGDDYECFGTVTVDGSAFNYKDEWCSDGDVESGSGTLVLNPTIDPDNNSSTDNNVTLNGIAQVKDENGNLTDEFVFVDPEAGYYISVDMGSGELSIGSNKPLK